MNLFDMDVGEVGMYSDRLGIMSDSQGKTSDSPLISLSPQTIWTVMKVQGDQVQAWAEGLHHQACPKAQAPNSIRSYAIQGV